MSRPRRSRYTVTLSDGDRSVILAYPFQDEAIRAHYARMGKDVVRIVKGDHVNVSADAGYRIDQSALRDAIELLGLKVPVRIRHNARVGQQRGNYRFRDGVHDIMVKSYLSPAEASSTLWHELTHALQCERDGKADPQIWGRVHADQQRWPYSRRPIEVEARRMSEDMADLPLCY